jgi:hypothetical protein
LGVQCAFFHGSTTMPKIHLSVSGLSILFSLGLAVWEVIFFFYGTTWESWFGGVGQNRLGFNLAWLAFVYLSFQLVSIPFTIRAAQFRFLGVVDGMSSLLPLAITIIVIFGRPELLGTEARWEAAILLLGLAATDLFGGYVINLALSRRMMEVSQTAVTP